MNNQSVSLRFLSGNALKIIAAACMLIDHIGFLFFPFDMVWRAIGRLAFPIFAFMIAEGCRYTRNKIKHFFLLFSLAVICQLVYYFVDGSLYMSVLVTFSISTLLIYALQAAQSALIKKRYLFGTLFAFLFAGLIAGTYFLNRYVEIDGGFWGCLLPVFPALIDFKQIPALAKRKTLEFYLRVLAWVIGLIPFTIFLSNVLSVQWCCLFAIPLLCCYSGDRGKYKLKYFFYIFYPAHLAILYGIDMLIMLL